MGRKSKLRRRKREEDFLGANNDLMALGLDDEDKPMSAKQSSKLKKKQRKLMRKQAKHEKDKSRYPQHKREKRGSESTKRSKWHCIKVHGGDIIEKHFLYTSIGNFVDVEFQPLGFHKIDKMSCFYLEDNEPAATAIGGLNKRLQGSDGSLLKIAVTNCQTPDLVLNSDQMEVLKCVLARRFNGSSCLLDLTDLHHDSELVEKDILVSLASPMIFKQVLRIIRENVPHIKALNLSKNNLRVGTLKMFQSLQTGTSQLNALNLGHNYIGDMQVLKCIKMFPITELSLEFNPLVDHYKQNPVKYVSLAKKELPGLKLLDSVDVDAYLLENGKPKLIQEPKLHLSEGGTTSSSSSVSEEMVRTYLEQYYSLIDTPERSNLVAAYTPDAVLEIKSTIASIGANVFVGQDKIGEALALLPATQHQQSSFSLDVKLLNTCAAQAIVKGQCQIAGIGSVINFSHSMNIVPYNAGLCCSQAVLEMR